MFIAFEGGEGAGKSTQIARAAVWLSRQGVRVRETREPGGTPGAEAVRSLFVSGEPDRWTPAADALLIAAARADHVARLIRPALAAGETVLCDRYVHSTLAYQGHGRGLPLDDLVALHRFATGDLWPDLILWIDLPVELGLARAQERSGTPDRFERRDMAFHQRVRDGFAALAAADPRIVRIDGTGTPEAVASTVQAAIAARR